MKIKSMFYYTLVLLSALMPAALVAMEEESQDTTIYYDAHEYVGSLDELKVLDSIRSVASQEPTNEATQQLKVKMELFRATVEPSVESNGRYQYPYVEEQVVIALQRDLVDQGFMRKTQSDTLVNKLTKCERPTFSNFLTQSNFEKILLEEQKASQPKDDRTISEGPKKITKKQAQSENASTEQLLTRCRVQFFCCVGGVAIVAALATYGAYKFVEKKKKAMKHTERIVTETESVV